MTSPLAPRNRLITADCIDGLAALGDGTVDLAFADPPFNIGYEYDVYDDRKQADQYLDWCRRWIGEVARVLKPDGTFWLAIGDEFAAELKVIALRVPSARQFVYGDRRANPEGRLPDDTWILRPQDIPGGGFRPGEDTWYIPRVCGTFKERAGFHGCQMPEQLLGRIIRVSSRPGDLVLDPFGGSGTTLVVAKKLGRDYLGYELSPDYAEQAQSRLDACEPGTPLQGGDEPRVDPTVSPTKRGRLMATEISKPVVAKTTRSVEPATSKKPKTLTTKASQSVVVKPTKSAATKSLKAATTKASQSVVKPTKSTPAKGRKPANVGSASGV
jgi:site-specific DNA-methyltransferase (adenine-specific)